MLPDDVERLLFDTDSVNPFELDARLRAAVRALQRIDFQTGRLLRLVGELRLHRAFGFASLPDYVRERLSCSARKTRALVALDRRLAELPMLAAADRDGRLSYARALGLLPVIHADNEAAWVARAQEVTVRRLGDLVDWALEAGATEPPPAEATLVLPPLDEVQMCARGCDAEVRFEGPASVVALFRTAVGAFTPRGAPAWEGLERLLLHVTAEWERRPRHRDPIFERDGWRCAGRPAPPGRACTITTCSTAHVAARTPVTTASPYARPTTSTAFTASASVWRASHPTTSPGRSGSGRGGRRCCARTEIATWTLDENPSRRCAPSSDSPAPAGHRLADEPAREDTACLSFPNSAASSASW